MHEWVFQRPQNSTSPKDECYLRSLKNSRVPVYPNFTRNHATILINNLHKNVRDNCSFNLRLGHGNESHRFASTARMPQKLPPKIFIIYKKFIIFTNKAKLNKISNKIVYWLQWNEHIAVCLSSVSTFYEITNYIHRNGEVGTHIFSAATVLACMADGP
jgi:hypothetical protein